MGKRGVPELVRKKVALIVAWNKLALELRGVHANDTTHNRITAGRLLELCQDKQGVFTTRARKFLNQTWRTYRRLGDLYRAWETLGDPEGTPERFETAKLSEPSGPNVFGYWKPPPGWNDPRNMDPAALRNAARKALERLRGRGEA